MNYFNFNNPFGLTNEKTSSERGMNLDRETISGAAQVGDNKLIYKGGPEGWV